MPTKTLRAMEHEAPLPELGFNDLARERARCSAAFLDSLGKWAIRIERPINIGNRGDCILGQLFGEYRKGLAELKLSDVQALELGFRACTREVRYSKAVMLSYYAELNKAWEEERKARLGQEHDASGATF